jgi:hypothetical protein
MLASNVAVTQQTINIKRVIVHHLCWMDSAIVRLAGMLVVDSGTSQLASGLEVSGQLDGYTVAA